MWRNILGVFVGKSSYQDNKRVFCLGKEVWNGLCGCCMSWARRELNAKNNMRIHLGVTI